MSLKFSRFAIGSFLLAATLSGVSQAQTPADDAAAVDEVVVTGSFIRRSEGFLPASPVAEISKDEFESHAPRTVADFLTTLPFSYNTNFTAGRALGSASGAGSINLRNLGSDATLVLLNSRRLSRDPLTLGNIDVNAVVPQIAIERIEILKDGASSTYGSDAVGGVANFLTRRNFNGAEAQVQGDMRAYGRNTDIRASAIWGAQTERSGIVASFEYFKRSPFYQESYGVIRKMLEGPTPSGGKFLTGGSPGTFLVPNRDGTGALILTGPASAASGTPQLRTTQNVLVADPACPLFSRSNVSSGSFTRAGAAYPLTCTQDVPLGTGANTDESRYSSFVELHHQINDSLNFFAEGTFLRSRSGVADTPGGTINPGRGQPPVIIPGYAPSNAFRAVNNLDQPLFAQSSGVQLSFDKDGNGTNDFLPARDPTTGRVIVVGTNPAALGANGLAVVPFWEDVNITTTSRSFNITCNLPGNPATSVNCRNGLNRLTRYAIDSQRFVGGLEGKLFGSDNWNYSGAFTYGLNGENDTTFGSGFNMPALRQALAGYGGQGCSTPSLDPLLSGTTIRPGVGNCQFFNYFGSSTLTTPGTLLANNLAMVDYVTAMDWTRYTANSQVMDFVISGSLFKLPAGDLSVAIGGQHRSTHWIVDYPTGLNRGESDSQVPFFDQDQRDSVNAVFGEISVPLVKNDRFGSLDLTGAVRYENTAGPGLDTTDPKIGLLYATPEKFLAVRGTWSTSFLSPTLYQRFRQSAAFINGANDPLTVGADPQLGRVTTVITGNPNLDPSTSTNYNLGFTITPVDNLSFDLDYWHFKFEDQINFEQGQAVLDEAPLDPNRVIRSTAAGSVFVNSVNVGQVVAINLTALNTASLITAGFDLGANYSLDFGKFGNFRTRVLASYQNKYEVDGRDLRRGRNMGINGASFAIPWKATLQNVWSVGSSSVQSLLRYTDGFDNNDSRGTIAPPAYYPFAKQFIEPYMSWDLSYSYALSLDRFGVSGADLSLGINNVMDKDPPYVPDANHTLFQLYDYSGRHIWARVKVAF